VEPFLFTPQISLPKKMMAKLLEKPLFKIILSLNYFVHNSIDPNRFDIKTNVKIIWDKIIKKLTSKIRLFLIILTLISVCPEMPPICHCEERFLRQKLRTGFATKQSPLFYQGCLRA
jgi:hypothetical protein